MREIHLANQRPLALAGNGAGAPWHPAFFGIVMPMPSLKFLLFSICAVQIAAVSAAEITELQLESAERTAIETAACRTRHGVSLERVMGRIYGKGSQAAAVAEAHCAASGSANGSPSHYVVQCARSNGVWDCQGEWNEITVPIQSAQPVAVRVEGEMTPAQATKVVQKIAAAGRFQGYELHKALASPCYVTQMKGREFIDVRCEGWHIIVSTWCPQDTECPRLLSIAKD